MRYGRGPSKSRRRASARRRPPSSKPPTRQVSNSQTSSTTQIMAMRIMTPNQAISVNGTPGDISAAGEIGAVERFGLVRVVDAQRDDAEGKNHRDQREIRDDDQLEAHSFPPGGNRTQPALYRT